MTSLNRIIFFTISWVNLLILHSSKTENIAMSQMVHKMVFDNNLTLTELSNGLKVAVISKSESDTVRLALAFKVGSNVEDDSTRGMAHLVEHMVLKGTEKLSEMDIAEQARIHGWSYNALTAHDSTTFFFQGPKANWQKFADILLDCMQNCLFSDEHLASEMHTVVEELRQRRSNPVFVAGENLTALSFSKEHPYHHPLIGYVQSLSKMTGAKLKAFYQRYYVPQNAVLTIAGDVDANQAIAYIKPKFEKVARGTEWKAPSYQPSAYPTGKALTTQAPIDQKAINLQWTIPGKKHDLLNNVVADFACGLLNQHLQQKLVHDSNVASIVALAATTLNDRTMITCSIVPTNEQDEGALLNLNNELTNFVQSGIMQAVLTQIINNTLAFLRRQFNDPKMAAAIWEQHFLVHYKADCWDDIIKIYEQKITPELIIEFVEKNLVHTPANALIVSPVKEEKRAAWLAEQNTTQAQEDLLLAKFKRTSKLDTINTTTAPLNTVNSYLNYKLDTLQADGPATIVNGLEILSCKDSAKPMTFAILKLKDHSYFSQAKTGFLLDLATSVLLECNPNFTYAELIAWVNAHNAGFSIHKTGITIMAPSANFLAAMEKFVEIMSKPVFTQTALDKAKTLQLGQLRPLATNPTIVGLTNFYQHAFANTGLAWSIEEAVAFVQQASLEEVAQAFQTFMNPSNLQMIVGGNFDQNALIKQLETSLKQWPTKSALHEVPQACLNKMPQEINVPLLSQQEALMFIKISSANFKHSDFATLKLLQQLLFADGLNAKIMQIRQQTGLFYNCVAALSDQAPGNPDLNLNLLRFEIAKGKIKALEDAVKGFLADLVANGITQQELDAAKQSWFTVVNGIKENHQVALATTLATYQLTGDNNYNLKLWQQIAALSLPEVNAAIRKHLDPKLFTIIRVGDVSDQQANKVQPQEQKDGLIARCSKWVSNLWSNNK